MIPGGGRLALLFAALLATESPAQDSAGAIWMDVHFVSVGRATHPEESPTAPECAVRLALTPAGDGSWNPREAERVGDMGNLRRIDVAAASPGTAIRPDRGLITISVGGRRGSATSTTNLRFDQTSILAAPRAHFIRTRFGRGAYFAFIVPQNSPPGESLQLWTPRDYVNLAVRHVTAARPAGSIRDAMQYLAPLTLSSYLLSPELAELRRDLRSAAESWMGHAHYDESLNGLIRDVLVAASDEEALEGASRDAYADREIRRRILSALKSVSSPQTRGEVLWNLIEVQRRASAEADASGSVAPLIIEPDLPAMAIREVKARQAVLPGSPDEQREARRYLEALASERDILPVAFLLIAGGGMLLGYARLLHLAARRWIT